MNLLKLSGTLLSAMLGTDAGLSEPLEDDKDSLPECLVQLREGTDDGPLFCFHPAGGELRIYEHLAPTLAGDFPIYGLKKTVKNAADLETLVTQYTDAIQTAHPAGPLRVLGFSLGGLLAVHTAARLEQAGREVEFVGVIECNPGDQEGENTREDRLIRFICETYELVRQEMGFIEELDPETLEAEAREVARQFDPLAVVDWILNSGHIIGHVPRGLVTDYFTRIGQDLVLMADNQVNPDQPLRSPIHVWTASDGMGTNMKAWQQWTKCECSHEIIEGQHFSVMLPPQIDLLTVQLNELWQSHSRLSPMNNQTSVSRTV